MTGKRMRSITDGRLKYDQLTRDELVDSVTGGELSVREAAQQLGCSRKYMQKLVHRERHPPITKVKLTRDQRATHLMVWSGITAALARRLTELGVYDQAELADLRSHDFALELRRVRGR